MNIRACALLLALGCTGHVLPATAAVTLQGTRVIYDGSKGAVTVNANNRGDKVSLAQVWLDDGDASAKAGSQKSETRREPGFRPVCGSHNECPSEIRFRKTFQP